MMSTKKTILILLAVVVGMYVIAGLVLANLVQQIDNQGGVAKSIGIFVHDVNKAANEK